MIAIYFLLGQHTDINRHTEYRIRQNIRGGKLSRFINNVHYVGKLSRFAALKPTRASAIRILECAQIRIKFDTRFGTRAGRMAEVEFETEVLSVVIMCIKTIGHL